MFFLATLSDEPFSLFLGDKSINQAQHYRYFGVLVDANLNFKQHMYKLLVKISKRFGVLERIRNNLTAGYGLLRCCMEQLIGKKERDNLNRAQRRAAKIVLKTTDSDVEKNLK